MFANLSARKKLLGIVAIATLAMAAITMLANIGLYHSAENIKSIYEDRMVPIRNLNAISGLLLDDQNLLKSAIYDSKPMAGSPESESTLQLMGILEKNISSSDGLWKNFLATALTPEEKLLANKFSEGYTKLLNTVLKPAMVYIQGNNVNEAVKLSSHITELINGANLEIDGLVKLQFDLALEAYRESVSRFQSALIISLLITLSSFGVMTWFGFNITQSLKRSLGGEPEELTKTLNRIASGDLDFRIQLEHGDHSSALAAIKSIQEKFKLLYLDTQILEKSVIEGHTNTRIHAEQHQGDFKIMVERINSTLDTTAQAALSLEADHHAVNKQILMNYVEEIQAIVMAAKNNNLTLRIPMSGKTGEIGLLCNSLNELLDSMEEIISQIKDASETINTATKEISIGNADLSQRTEEQAASLEETASSMEELASTVKQNAENAKQANLSAITASEVALRGGKAIKDVVATMVNINNSASKIEDIVSVIDGIAFQTNILALNAAVEAARAGEQGRGFAVVAAEVRNLAQRSASAAKEIKGLIGASVKNTAQGYDQVEKAGQTMEEIVISTQRVSDIIAEITAASLEQSSGIDQVNNAVGQMDSVTQQNAALVEQAAAAAESLMEQSNMLSQSVSQFTVKGDDHRLSRETLRPTFRSESVAEKLVKPHISAATKNSTEDADWELF